MTTTPTEQAMTDKQEPVALKDCPFCGGPATLHQSIDYNTGEKIDLYWVQCDPCDMFPDQAWDKPKVEAITAWNTRANRPADDGLVAWSLAIAGIERDTLLHDLTDEEIAGIATALRAQSDAEVERIVAWLNQLGDIWSARQIAAMIEAGEHRKDGV